MLDQNFNIEYNSAYDILYVRFGDNKDTYGKEIDDGIVLKYDCDTNNLVGIDIWDFKLRVNNAEKIPIPIPLDLNSVYKDLIN